MPSGRLCRPSLDAGVGVTVKASIHATGSRLEPRIDNVVEWSYPIEGELEIHEGSARFGDWVIPNNEVSDAVLNTERFLFKRRQTLLIESDGQKYVFGFYDPIDVDFEFPFAVRVTEKRSFVGKLLLFAVAAFLLGITWELVKLIVRA